MIWLSGGSMIYMENNNEDGRGQQVCLDDAPSRIDYDGSSPTGSLACFPVDISREEFVRFNMIVSATTGLLRLRKGQMILHVGISLIVLFMLLSDFIAYRIINPSIVLMLLFSVAAGIAVFYGAPSYVKRTAERAYEQSRLTGHTYYGIISVYTDRIQKQSPKSTVTLKFSDNVLYIETKDMIIFLSPKQPAVVIPARCIDKDKTQGVRRAVFIGIPPVRQRIEDRIVPAKEPRILSQSGSSTDNWDTDSGICINVNYKKDEFVKTALDTALSAFMKMLPAYSAFALITGLTIGFLYNFAAGLVVYLIVNVVNFLLQVPGARSKAKVIYDKANTDLSVCFTEHGIIVKTRTDTSEIRLKWTDVTRAVAGNDSFKFYSRYAVLSIPTRCVEDKNALRSFVDSHYPAS